MISRSLKSGFVMALGLGFAGMVTGGVMAWVAMILGDGVEGISTWGARLFLVLAGVLPVLVAAVANGAVRGADRVLFVDTADAFAYMGMAGIGGALMASALFLVPAINLPTVFQQLDAVAMNEALMAHMSWARVGLVVGTTALTAAVAAGWGHRYVAAH